jgi:hypothetical protein
MRKDIREYYSALNLSPGATPVQIRRAYRQIVRRWHPDLFKPGSPMQTTAEDITKEANEAFEQLIRKQLYRRFPPKVDQDADPGLRARKAAEDEEGARSEEPKQREPAPPKPGPAAGRRSRAKRVFRKPPKPGSSPRWTWKGAFRRSPGQAPRQGSEKAVRRNSRWTFRRLSWGAAILACLVAAGVGIRALSSVDTQAKGSRRYLLTELTSNGATPSASPVEGPASVTAPATPRVVVAPIATVVAAHAMNERGQALNYEMTHSGHFIIQGLTPSSAPAPASNPVEGPASSSVEGFAQQYPETEYNGRWLAAPSAEPRAGAFDPASASRIVDDAEAYLETFGMGDSKSRVLSVQGAPDEAKDSVFRYGSSLVYFENGVVRGWADRQPRLHIRRWPSLDLISLDTFSAGSSRADVVRAQGRPSAFNAFGYRYGSSMIYFRDGLVSGWAEGDTPLRTFEMPKLPLIDLDALLSK